MKKIYKLMMVAAALCAVGCVQPENVEFASDCDEITIDAVGGSHKLRISSSDSWIASTDNTWITISPANGRGSAECRIQIDSALHNSARHGEVLIQNLQTHEERTITINQEGFPYAIDIEESEISIANYKPYNERKFSVTLNTNVDFEVEIPSNARWLSHKKYEVNLNRGIRPREVKVEFEWDINTMPRERVAEVRFVPKNGETLERQQNLVVTQLSAEPIEENSRKGDSVALISIQRSLQTLSSWDTSLPMERWDGVELWDKTNSDCPPEKVGRVRRAQFYIYASNEELPFEVKYLTAAEELFFFGNANTFLKSLRVGEEITELTQLRRLTIGAHGLIDLDPSFAKLKNLEYLDLCSNNFMKIPEVLTKENFPKLRTLILNANQRSSVYDLSNMVKSDIGGFIEEEKFPSDLLKWGLDTLNLSVNYLHGSLPTFEDDPEVPVYTEEDWAASRDTLPRMLVDKRIKKVMTKTKFFSINFNRLTGMLPDWLLYHPMLDHWFPTSLIFNQEGKDMDGNSAGFENEPVNLDYYYDLYPFKKQPTGEEGVE
ncbi:MAG: hypothetical protein II323_04500 [Tidjanibacter sp.]|nr:hypothetical protein [Tidjanibacter sp.]